MPSFRRFSSLRWCFLLSRFRRHYYALYAVFYYLHLMRCCCQLSMLSLIFFDYALSIKIFFAWCWLSISISLFFAFMLRCFASFLPCSYAMIFARYCWLRLRCFLFAFDIFSSFLIFFFAIISLFFADADIFIFSMMLSPFAADYFLRCCAIWCLLMIFSSLIFVDYPCYCCLLLSSCFICHCLFSLCFAMNSFHCIVFHYLIISLPLFFFDCSLLRQQIFSIDFHCRFSITSLIFRYAAPLFSMLPLSFSMISFISAILILRH